MVKCLCCEKDLSVQMVGSDDHIQPDGGGVMRVTFGYGSRHDQLGGLPLSQEPIEVLLKCNEIEAYICDECFDTKFRLMNGFKVTKTVRRDLEFGA